MDNGSGGLAPGADVPVSLTHPLRAEKVKRAAMEAFVNLAEGVRAVSRRMVQGDGPALSAIIHLADYYCEKDPPRNVPCGTSFQEKPSVEERMAEKAVVARQNRQAGALRAREAMRAKKAALEG